MRAVPVFLAALFTLLTLSATGRAADPIETTRQIIEQQIEAFLRDDADAAYAFAAPGIKARFPDKAAFFAMVKKNYQPVYHPGNYAFGRSRAVEDGSHVMHELMISGQDGRNWKAIYKLSRQADGLYKIDGVLILPDRISKGI